MLIYCGERGVPRRVGDGSAAALGDRPWPAINLRGTLEPADQSRNARPHAAACRPWLWAFRDIFHIAGLLARPAGLRNLDLATEPG